MKIDLKKIAYYGGSSEHIILRDISFEVVANSVFTILGRNGAGKSTLLKGAANLLDKNRYKIMGEILFDGIDILSASEKELQKIRREKIKFVFQDASRSFDPLKKLSYYFDITSPNRKDAEELLDFFQLPPLEKISTLYPYEISGGMAQRLSFILALLTYPSVIILDEPTSGIDPAIVNLFLLKIKEFASERSNRVLLVTQDILFAEKAGTKISLLENGTLSGFKSPSEFFSQNDREKIFETAE